VLFVATLASVYLVYGFQWTAGNPLTDPEIAAQAGRFAVGLMAILLAHEMGHYLVARHHGFRLSLPYFIPLPMAFGTFGAVIRLKSLPRSRTALLEMGAAGPLAGLFVALLVMAIGMPGTVEHALPVVVQDWPPEPGWLDRLILSLGWAQYLPPADTHTLSMAILANPPLMDLLGTLLLGAPPGRYAELDPLAMAGWVGCLLTAINLIPIGQLDGGHVFNALFPSRARLVGRIGLAAAFLGVLVWPGWLVWGALLLTMRASVSLPVPSDPPPSRRARWTAVAALAALLVTFMPRPIEVETFDLDELTFQTPDGRVIPNAEVRAWLEHEAASRSGE